MSARTVPVDPRGGWRRIVVLLAVWLVLAPSPAGADDLPPGGTFIDDDGSPQEAYIEAIHAAGITAGCNPPANDRYCPGLGLTRAEMATMLVRALHLERSGIDRFEDDGNSVHEANINALAADGITRGCNPPTGDRFCPDDLVTRGQMAAFLVRALELTAGSGTDRFGDDDRSVFENDIDRLADAGITKGCNPPANDRYCPGAATTRGQMAVFLTRALGLTPITPPVPALDLEVVSRAAWGAAPADRSKMHGHTIELLTVHHAGDQTTTTGPARYRSWQSFHMSRGWGDLAYHYIIGVDGTVYEGRDTRYAGATGTNYEPSGHFLVVVEGNFDHDRPTQAQRDSLVRVLAWASTEFGVSPSTIAGHRDHAATTCPGGNLYPYIAGGEIERDVRALLASG
jgi:hypothetical protein